MADPINLINETIKTQCQSSKELICYVTSDLMFKALKQDDARKAEFKSIDAFCDFLRTKPSEIYNIEITISTPNYYYRKDKESLKKKYGMKDLRGYQAFVFSEKYDYLRLFMHAFNIFLIGNHIIVGQSWMHKHLYKVIYDFESDIRYEDFLTQLIMAVHNFTNNPLELYTLFGISDTFAETKIFEMIRRERMKVQTDVVCYY